MTIQQLNLGLFRYISFLPVVYYGVVYEVIQQRSFTSDRSVVMRQPLGILFFFLTGQCIVSGVYYEVDSRVASSECGWLVPRILHPVNYIVLGVQHSVNCIVLGVLHPVNGIVLGVLHPDNYIVISWSSTSCQLHSSGSFMSCQLQLSSQFLEFHILSTVQLVLGVQHPVNCIVIFGVQHPVDCIVSSWSSTFCQLHSQFLEFNILSTVQMVLGV